MAGLLVLFLRVLLGVVAVYGQGFAADFRIWGISLKSGIGANGFEIVFVMELSFFVMVGFVIEVAGLFLRYVFIVIRHSWHTDRSS
jgi:hypothetical protein